MRYEVSVIVESNHPPTPEMFLEPFTALAFSANVKGTRGLVMCCHCGAHKRTSDGAWVHPHLVSSAIQAGRRCKRP